MAMLLWAAWFAAALFIVESARSKPADMLQDSAGLSATMNTTSMLESISATGTEMGMTAMLESIEASGRAVLSTSGECAEAVSQCGIGGSRFGLGYYGKGLELYLHGCSAHFKAGGCSSCYSYASTSAERRVCQEGCSYAAKIPVCGKCDVNTEWAACYAKTWVGGGYTENGNDVFMSGCDARVAHGDNCKHQCSKVGRRAQHVCLKACDACNDCKSCPRDTGKDGTSKSGAFQGAVAFWSAVAVLMASLDLWA